MPVTTDPLSLPGDLFVGPDAFGQTTVWDNRDPEWPEPLTEAQLTNLVVEALGARDRLADFARALTAAEEAMESEHRDSSLVLEELVAAGRKLVGAEVPR